MWGTFGCWNSRVSVSSLRWNRWGSNRPTHHRLTPPGWPTAPGRGRARTGCWSAADQRTPAAPGVEDDGQVDLVLADWVPDQSITHRQWLGSRAEVVVNQALRRGGIGIRLGAPRSSPKWIPMVPAWAMSPATRLPDRRCWPWTASRCACGELHERRDPGSAIGSDQCHSRLQTGHSPCMELHEP